MDWILVLKMQSCTKSGARNGAPSPCKPKILCGDAKSCARDDRGEKNEAGVREQEAMDLKSAEKLCRTESEVEVRLWTGCFT